MNTAGGARGWRGLMAASPGCRQEDPGVLGGTWGTPKLLIPPLLTLLLFPGIKFHRPLGLSTGCGRKIIQITLLHTSYGEHIPQCIPHCIPQCIPQCILQCIPQCILRCIPPHPSLPESPTKQCCPQQPLSPSRLRSCGESGKAPQDPHWPSEEQQQPRGGAG